MSTPRDMLVYRAKLSEQAERYEEMVELMRSVAKEEGELSVEERNLLSVAYKNIIGTRRTSWRILSSIEQREEHKSAGQGETPRLVAIRKYRAQVEQELKKICSEVGTLLDDTLIPKATNTEAIVFLRKMKGDYFRYLAEILTGADRDSAAEASLKAYKQASELCEAELSATHPIRLGLALNFSVYYYEILNQPEAACKLAKHAFDEAIAQLDTLPEDSYKDSTLIMQLLRDNLTLWTSDLPQDDAKPEAAPAAAPAAEKA